MADTKPETEALRRTPEPENASIPAAHWSDLWEYHLAIGGEGEHALNWSDKPHRLVYDLTKMVANLRAALSKPVEVAPDDEALIIQRLRNIAFDLNTSMLDDVTEALRRRLAELVSDLADARKALAACRSATIEECAAVVEQAGAWKYTGKDRDNYIASSIRALKKEPTNG